MSMSDEERAALRRLLLSLPTMDAERREAVTRGILEFGTTVHRAAADAAANEMLQLIEAISHGGN